MQKPLRMTKLPALSRQCLSSKRIKEPVPPGEHAQLPIYRSTICRPPIQAIAKQLYNIYTTSAQRLRRWSNIVFDVIQIFCVAGLQPLA